ncbi:MAG: YeeE/YedE family protein [Trueperaceae bacterium]|nr:YeeE/YedE family protein [Trueperaceae bacterium]
MQSARTTSPTPPRAAATSAVTLLPYLAAGTAFGFVAIRSEIASWYRIQEMFRFQSFHMYGVIGAAVLVAALSVWAMRRFGARARDGQPIHLPDKDRTWPRYALGGTAFGLGWALVGACPGPILALIGAGLPAFLVVLVGAVAGTWTYGVLKDRLPHGTAR